MGQRWATGRPVPAAGNGAQSLKNRPPLPPGFGTIWTAVAIDLVGFGIVLPILPLYAKRFHTTSLEATLLVSVFSAASLVCSPLWGRVSDRFGRKPVLLVSLAGTAAGSLITGLAGGLAVLLVGRIVDGASGASVSVAQAAAADLAGPADRARLFGLLGAAFGVGFVAGPALGSLAALGGPRLPFFLAAGIATVNTVIASRRLPETHATRPRPRRSGLDSVRAVAPMLVVTFLALVAFSGFEATFALFGSRHLGLGIASTAAVFTAVGAVIVVVQGGLVVPGGPGPGRDEHPDDGPARQRRRSGPPGDGLVLGGSGAGAGGPDGGPGPGPDDDGGHRGRAGRTGVAGERPRGAAVGRRPGPGRRAGPGRGAARGDGVRLCRTCSAPCSAWSAAAVVVAVGRTKPTPPASLTTVESGYY